MGILTTKRFVVAPWCIFLGSHTELNWTKQWTLPTSGKLIWRCCKQPEADLIGKSTVNVLDCCTEQKRLASRMYVQLRIAM